MRGFTLPALIPCFSDYKVHLKDVNFFKIEGASPKRSQDF